MRAKNVRSLLDQVMILLCAYCVLIHPINWVYFAWGFWNYFFYDCIFLCRGCDVAWIPSPGSWLLLTAERVHATSYLALQSSDFRVYIMWGCWSSPETRKERKRSQVANTTHSPFALFNLVGDEREVANNKSPDSANTECGSGRWRWKVHKTTKHK